MATPQPPYDGAPNPEDGQYAQDGTYGEQAAPATAALKKKRGYAGQAYEFGAGGNAALGGGGAPPAGSPYPGQPAPQAGYGGYGYQAQPADAQQQPQYGMPQQQQPAYGAAPGVGSPAPQGGFQQPGYGAQGGYEAPAPGYPTSGPGQPGAQPGVAGITQQFGQMGMGGGALPPQPLPPQQQGVQMRLNPLQPVDISAQGAPFHVSDLDQPPPQIILPPNVSASLSLSESETLTRASLVICDTITAC